MKPVIRPSVATTVKQQAENIDLDLVGQIRPLLKIDKEALDTAMAEQADLFFRVSEAYALAVSRRDAAKEFISAEDAHLDMELRVGKAEKPTESQIKALIQTHQRHLAAYGKYAQEKKNADILGGLKEALQDRGRMLRDLGNLYSAGYFTVSSSKGAASRLGREVLNHARHES